MNLYTVSIFAKKYSWVPFYLVGILVFVILILNRQGELQTSTPEEIEKLTVEDQPVSSGKYTIKSSAPSNIPESLPTYETLDDSGFIEISDDIVKQFGVTGDRIEKSHNQYGEGLVVNGPKGMLSIYKNFVSFNPSPTSSEKIAGFSEQQLVEGAKKYLAKFTFSGAELSGYRINYYHFPEGEEENFYLDPNPDGASLARVEFTENLESYELITGSTPTSVTFARDGNLISAHIKRPERINNTSSYPILSYEKAVEWLTIIGGNVISVYGEGSILADEEPENRKIQSTEIAKAYLAYYQSTRGNTIQPVWVFEGGSTIKNLPISTKTIVPAIKQANYKN